MSTETAQLVLGLIAGIGFVVWLAGLQFLLASARAGKSAASVSGELTELLPADWLVGSVEVQGQPAALVKRAAGLLVKLGAGNVGTVKILECTEDRLVFERVGPLTGQQQGNWFRRGELRFTPQGRERTVILYAVERAPLRWLLWLGSLFLLLGLIGLIAGYWLLHTLVASSPDPNVRWQTIQMAQIVHFLWPPFLFGGLYRRFVHSLRATFEALTTNLPYAE